MKVLFRLMLALAFLAAAADAHEGEHSRVIVSSTLNSSLLFFDAETLGELQPPLFSRGGGPVRLWVQEFDGKPFLLAANHGAGLGSVGVFDLSMELVTELPLSPFPARAGSVGIAAGNVMVGSAPTPMVFVTNTYFALGPCEIMPAGSLTAYDATLLGSVGVLQEIGTVDLSGAVPFAVSVDGGRGLAFASVNCASQLDTIAVERDPSIPEDAPLARRFRLAHRGSRVTGIHPDASIFDPASSLNYVLDIDGGSVSVFDALSATALTVVPLEPGVHPIDATLAEGKQGGSWLVTSDGGGDSVSLIDRKAVEACVFGAAPSASCPQAAIARFHTKEGGEPEGVAFDPETDRIFAVNKYPIGAPSLSVVHLDEDGVGHVVGGETDVISLGSLGAATPLPALIAFDLVVQKR